MEHLPSWTSQALLQSLSGLDSRPKGEQAEEDYRSGIDSKYGGYKNILLHKFYFLNLDQ